MKRIWNEVMMQRNDAEHIRGLGEPNVYDDPESRAVLEAALSGKKGAGVHTIVQAGQRRGAKVDWIGRGRAVLTLEGKEILLSGQRNVESIAGGRIVRDKQLTRRLLAAQGLPAARGVLVPDVDAALEFQRELGAPIVIKPLDGNLGRGVTVGLTDAEHIESAFQKAAAVGQVLAEEDVQADAEYRCHATPTDCVSVFRRILPWVEGDGEATIAELIARKNVGRKTNPSTANRPIPVDESVRAVLGDQGLHLDYVLESGRRIIVRSVGGLGSGGEPEECFGSAPKDAKQLAVQCIAAIPGLEWGGVDIMIDREGRPRVIEVNTNADALGAIYTYYGTAAPVAELVFDMRLERAPVLPARAPRPLPAGPFAAAESASAEGARPEPFPEHLSGPGEGILRRLLHRELDLRGAEQVEVTNSMTQASFRDGSSRWFAGLGSESDLSAAWTTAEMHGPVRRLLRRSAVPRTRAIIGADRKRLTRFLQELASGTAYLTPVSAAWGAGYTVEVSTNEELEHARDSRRGRWVVQEKLPGSRLLVVATPEEALMAFGSSAVPPLEVSKASEIAVLAVRAIPELRWACVDLVLPQTEGDRSKPKVQGIQFEVDLAEDEMLLAGDPRQFLDLVIG